jgi:hypothetical protein
MRRWAAVALLALAGCGQEEVKPITDPIDQTHSKLKWKQQTEKDVRALGKERAGAVDKILDQRNKAIPKP